MFRKTGRNNLARVLFSPARKPRFGIMSILLTTVFPLALSGAGLTALAAPAAPVATPAPVIAPRPAVAAPTGAPKIMPAVMVTKPVVAPPVTLSPAPAGVELIQIQAPAPAPVPDRTAIVDRVSKALTEVRTAQGKFTQVYQGRTSLGAFYISRPGKVRFDYTSPEPMHIVSDGTTVSIEEPKRESYDSMPLASTTLNLFLRSNVDLNRDVTEVRTSSGSHFVTLVDKSGEAEGRIVLEFRASDFELLGWRAIDGEDMETRVSLSDTKKNISLKQSLFVVKPPEDDRR
jgi:outer membrane lipoprotein-sorting protein